MQPIDTLRTLMNDPTLQWQEEVQSLWSGYGQIARLHSTKTDTLYIAKVIQPQHAGQHPRGWNTQASHKRKLFSYRVELEFYQAFSHKTDIHCKVPQLFASDIQEDKSILIMEDLDALGFSKRRESASLQQLDAPIKWLAFFHARFIQDPGHKLWPVGTYWHLATRQDEWSNMPTSPLKQYAQQIDQMLNQARYPSLVHGDAKLANFCFQHDLQSVAAVDFQYIGRGPGVKDLAYLLGSAMNEKVLASCAELALERYLGYVSEGLSYYGKAEIFNPLAQECIDLFPLAWADFHRFLLGWNPQSWKLNGYMADMSQRAIVWLESKR